MESTMALRLKVWSCFVSLVLWFSRTHISWVEFSLELSFFYFGLDGGSGSGGEIEAQYGSDGKSREGKSLMGIISLLIATWNR